MPKFVWLCQCPRHPDYKHHFIKKTDAKNYYRWHLKDCMDVCEIELIEAPFLG